MVAGFAPLRALARAQLRECPTQQSRADPFARTAVAVSMSLRSPGSLCYCAWQLTRYRREGYTGPVWTSVFHGCDRRQVERF